MQDTLAQSIATARRKMDDALHRDDAEDWHAWHRVLNALIQIKREERQCY